MFFIPLPTNKLRLETILKRIYIELIKYSVVREVCLIKMDPCCQKSTLKLVNRLKCLLSVLTGQCWLDLREVRVFYSSVGLGLTYSLCMVRDASHFFPVEETPQRDMAHCFVRHKPALFLTQKQIFFYFISSVFTWTGE